MCPHLGTTKELDTTPALINAGKRPGGTPQPPGGPRGAGHARLLAGRTAYGRPSRGRPSPATVALGAPS